MKDPFVRTIERESETGRAKKVPRERESSCSWYFCAGEVWIEIARWAAELRQSAHDAGAAQSPAAARLTLTASRLRRQVGRWECGRPSLRSSPPDATHHPPARPSCHPTPPGLCRQVWQADPPSEQRATSPPTHKPASPSSPRTNMTVEKQSRSRYAFETRTREIWCGGRESARIQDTRFKYALGLSETQ